jgi:hypothetical protein
MRIKVHFFFDFFTVDVKGGDPDNSGLDMLSKSSMDGVQTISKSESG